MKKILFITFLLLLCGGMIMALETNSRMAQMEQAYKNLQANRTVETQEAYFEAFPSTYKELCRMERYNSEHSTFKKEWMDAFWGLDAIDDTVYCIKAYNAMRGNNGFDYDPREGRITPFLLPKDYEDYERHRARFSVMMWVIAQLSRGEQFCYWANYFDSLKSGDREEDEEYAKKLFYDTMEIVCKEQPSMQKVCMDAYYYFSRQMRYLSDPYDFREFGIKTKFNLKYRF